MLTGILNRLGCVIPDKLLPVNFANERGYFESWKVYDLNNRILQSIGSGWDDWTQIPVEWFDSSEAAEFQAEAESLLEQEFGTGPMLALKDPRINRLMPLWRRALAAQQIELVTIHIHRHPLEVAASLQERDDMPTDYGQLLWLRNVLEAEAVCRDLPRHVMYYPDLLANWDDVLRRSEATLGIEWPKPYETVAEGVEAFISPQMWHFQMSTNPEQDLGLIDWVRDAFAILQQWATTGIKKADYARLDAIRHELNQIEPIFSGLLAEGRQLAKDAALHEGTLEDRLAKLEYDYLVPFRELNARQAEAKEQNQQLTQQIETLQSLLNQAQRDVAVNQANVQSLTAGMEAERLKAAGLQSENDRFRTSVTWRLQAPLRGVMRLFRA